MLAILLDFLLVAFSCFGYLLRPHLSRALAGCGGARIKRSWQLARSVAIGVANRPLVWWRRWQLRHLTGFELGLAKLGAELERFGVDGRDFGGASETETDEDGSVDRSSDVTSGNLDARINNNVRADWMALARRAATAYYSNKLSPSAEKEEEEGKFEGEARPTATAAEFYFVERDDPIVCSINWMNCDLICPAGYANDLTAHDGTRLQTNQRHSVAGAERAKQKGTCANTETGAGRRDSPQAGPARDEAKPGGGGAPAPTLVAPLRRMSSVPTRDKGAGNDQGDSARKRIHTERGNSNRPSGKRHDEFQTGDGSNNDNNDPSRAPTATGDRDDAGDNHDDAAAQRRATRGKRRPGQHAEPEARAARARGSTDASLVSVRAIWSAAGGADAGCGETTTTTNRELILIQQQQQQQQQRSTAHANRAFLLAELYTHHQLLRFEARSSLIFYFIQLYPNELAPLFGLISQLLERAGLIAPSGYCCRRSSRRKTLAVGSGRRNQTVGDRERSTSRGANCQEERLRSWLELVGWDLFDDAKWLTAPAAMAATRACSARPRGRASHPEEGRHGGRLIDRYALALMIVAHLERERSPGRPRASPNEQIRLASSLLSFFKCYSSWEAAATPASRVALLLVHSPAATVAAANTGQAASNKDVRMEIEFVDVESGRRRSATPESTASTTASLAVLDPIEFRLNASLAQAFQAKPSEQPNRLASCQANLTGRLAVWPDIRALFADCHSLIERELNAPSQSMTSSSSSSSSSSSTPSRADAREPSDEAQNGTPIVTLMDSLFELAECSRSKRERRFDLSDHIEQIFNLSQQDSATTDNQFIFSDADNGIERATADVHGRRRVGSNIKRARCCPGLGTRALAGLSKLTQNKLIRSLFFLALFVIVRFTLIRYLQSLQRDLIHESRDDFIALKRMLFPGGLRMVDSEDGPDEDGISILMRDEAEEMRAERASREKQRRDTNSRHAESGSASEEVSDNKLEPAASKEDQAQDDEMNQVMEALLTGLLSRAMGGGVGGEKGMGDMKPEQMIEIMKMLSETEEGEEPMNETEMAEMMEMMKGFQGLAGKEGAGGLDMASLAGMMGSAGMGDLFGNMAQEAGANIDPASFDYEDTDVGSRADERFIADETMSPNGGDVHEQTQVDGASDEL